MKTGAFPKEKRGGSRIRADDVTVTDSIISHISSFYVTESHYMRNKSLRQYLPCELNVKKMWRMWKLEREKANSRTCSFSKYHHVFSTKFNLGFGSPRVDICSTCVNFQNKIAAQVDIVENSNMLKLHRLRAKKFRMLMEQSRLQRDTLTVVFDMQQNKPLPHINIGETYYSRQLWLYNLGIVVHTHNRKQPPRNIRFYTWLETDSGKGSNEICSALHHFLCSLPRRLKTRGYKRLHLYCDSCPAQNKNMSMMAMLLTYMNGRRNVCFEEIRITFPIRGHSYMPPDQVFGRLEKEYRKKELIKTPQGYYEIMQKHGRIRELHKHWQVYDFKRLADAVLKKTFKSTETVMWLLEKSKKNKIQTFRYYSALPESHDIRRNKSINFSGRKAQLLPRKSHLTEEKHNDVVKLLSYILLSAEEEEFYSRILEDFTPSKRQNKTKNRKLPEKAQPSIS